MVASEPGHDEVVTSPGVPAAEHQLVGELTQDLRLLSPGQLSGAVPEPPQSLAGERGPLSSEWHRRVLSDEERVTHFFLVKQMNNPIIK